MSTTPRVGEHLREWRQRRRMSQLDLACDAEISARHLSFIETGRAAPSRDMLLHLTERLDVPLRERNILLVAAGFAPLFPERTLQASALEPARKAVELVLAGHEPYPALAIDRHWTLVTANAALMRLLDGVPADLLKPPVNVLRVSLHPAGLAPRIVNLADWRAHLFERLRRQIELTADATLIELLDELRAFPAPARRAPPATRADDYAGVVVPLQLVAGDVTLALFSTTTVFGTPVDVTVSELAIESFFPANGATAERLREMARKPA
jgi:transcriptional regulator with XRE-family HTH domain